MIVMLGMVWGCGKVDGTTKSHATEETDEIEAITATELSGAVDFEPVSTLAWHMCSEMLYIHTWSYPVTCEEVTYYWDFPDPPDGSASDLAVQAGYAGPIEGAAGGSFEVGGSTEPWGIERDAAAAADGCDHYFTMGEQSGWCTPKDGYFWEGLDGTLDIVSADEHEVTATLDAWGVFDAVDGVADQHVSATFRAELCTLEVDCSLTGK